METSTLRADILDKLTTTVDAVADLGWDDTGTNPITVPFNNNYLIEVPPGTYYIDTTQSGSPTAWGLIGQGATPEDVQFIGPGTAALRGFQLARGSRDILFENVSLHHHDTPEGCLGSAWLVDDGLLLNDVHFTGTTPSELVTGGATSLCNAYIFEATGTGIIDGIEMVGPSVLEDYPDNPLAIFSGPETKGTIYIRNSSFANRGEHAIYASRCEGNIRIEDCWFKNNQNTHARISGEGSYAKDSTFIWDITDHPNTGTFQATTGLTWEAGEHGYAGGLVERCEFISYASAGNSGCLKVDGAHGGMTARECVFDIRDATTPVNVEAPGDSHMITGEPNKPWEVEFEKVHVTSAGGTSPSSDAGIKIVERDRSKLIDCCISTDGRHGLRADGSGTTVGVEGGNISAAGDFQRIIGTATVETSNVGAGGTCSTSLATISTETSGTTAGFWDRVVSDVQGEGIWARLASADGSVTILADDILSGGLELRHTAISTTDIEVPPRERTPGLVLGRAELFFEDVRLFGGVIHGVPGPSTEDTQTVEIRGPAASIDGGDLSISITNETAHSVIADVWANHTPFDFTVHPPDRVTYLGTGEDSETGEPIPFESDGTVLSILQDLHDRAGMRFTVRHDQSTLDQPVVESYVPGEIVQPADWTALSYDSKLNPDGYANKITVYGRKPDAPTKPRPQWTANDYDEQDIYGVYPRPDGAVFWDAELTTSGDCRERAESLLDEKADEITVAGSVEVTPQLVHPGYHYPVPSLDDELQGDTLPLDRVSVGFLGDEPTATLEFAETNRLADKLVEMSRKATRANRLL